MVQDKAKIRILDLGCGTGAASWYLAREGFSVCGIDGSATAIRKAQQRLAEESLQCSFEIGDASKLPWPADTFQVVVDIAAIQHNTIPSMRAILAEVLRTLKPHGQLFSMMIGAGSYGDGLGTEIEPGTFAQIPEGPFAGKGTVHFFSESDISHVLSPFEILSLELSSRTLQERRRHLSHWIAVGRKPEPDIGAQPCGV